MDLAELAQQLRQPGPGDAGKAADPQGILVQPALGRRLPAQCVSRVDHCLHVGQQLLPLL